MKPHLLAPVFFLATLGCLEGTKADVLKRQTTLYQRLGGDAGVKKVVDDFVVEVVASEQIREPHKKHFREGDVDGLKRKLRDQFGQETGGPEKYTGKNMKDAHKGMQITDADFLALVDALVKALDKNKVSKTDQQELLDRLGPFKADVIEEPGLKGVIKDKAE